MKTVGDRIRERREELGMTQLELAKRLGYKTKSTITKIETNINSPTMPMVAKFAEALMVKPSYLMGWEDPQTPSYYPDPTVTVVANKLKDNDNYRVLFEAVSKVKPEDIDFVTSFIKRMGGDL